MFNFLFTILCWALFVAIAAILWKNKIVSDRVLSSFGLLFLLVFMILAFANAAVAEQPIVKALITLLFFPTTILGLIVTILFFNWKKIKVTRFSIKSGEAKYEGEKFNNKDFEDKAKSARKWIGFALALLVVTSNNALSSVFICYLVEQGDYAVEQAYRKDIRDISEPDIKQISQDKFNLIMVMSGEAPYKENFFKEVANREILKRQTGNEPPVILSGGQVRGKLVEAASIYKKAKENADRNNEPQPFILLSGGRTIIPSQDGYPCGIIGATDKSDSTRLQEINRSREDVRNDIADPRGSRGLKFDPRYEHLFKPNSPTEPLNPVAMTEADDMCYFLTKLAGIPRSAIVLEPNGINIRRSAEKVKEMEDKKFLPSFSGQGKSRILLLTSPLENARAFVTFRQVRLNVVPRPVYTADFEECKPSQRPWPLRADPRSDPQKFQIAPEKILLSAEAFVHSEQAWKESLTLFLYWLRTWVIPPLTDERPYTPIDTPPASSPPSRT